MGYGGKLPKLPGRTVWFNGYNVIENNISVGLVFGKGGAHFGV